MGDHRTSQVVQYRAPSKTAASEPRSTAAPPSGTPPRSGCQTISSATAPPTATSARCDCWSVRPLPRARTSTRPLPPPEQGAAGRRGGSGAGRPGPVPGQRLRHPRGRGWPHNGRKVGRDSVTMAKPVPPWANRITPSATQQLGTDRRPGVVPVHHGLEVPLQVGPADLPAVHVQLLIHRPAVTADDPLDGVTQQGPQPSGRAAGVDSRKAAAVAVAAAHSQQRAPRPASSRFHRRS